MWIPPLMALSATLGPSAMMAAVIYISRKIVSFYDEVIDFSESIVEMKENQEIIINQQKELLIQKELSMKEKSFDYSSYLTYDMLFKATLIVVAIVGCVYCYNNIVVSSSDVLSTLKDMDTSTKDNFAITNKTIVEAITQINNSTIQTVGTSSQGIVSLIENHQIVNEQTSNIILQKMEEAFNNQTEAQVKLSQIEFKMLKNILEIVSKRGLSENTEKTVVTSGVIASTNNNDFEWGN